MPLGFPPMSPAEVTPPTCAVMVNTYFVSRAGTMIYIHRTSTMMLRQKEPGIHLYRAQLRDSPASPWSGREAAERHKVGADARLGAGASELRGSFNRNESFPIELREYLV